MQKVWQVTVRKAVVPVFALPHLAVHEVNKVCSCKKFRDYVARAEESQEDNLSVSISKIEILSIEMFGDKIGFVTMRAYTTNHGFSLPAYVFLRGPAVAILMIVNTKILVVEQYRVPVQQLLLEAPAGMLDESGDFVGTAAKEIEEETSIRLCKDRLLPLGSFYPSPGGCDEEILMFYCELTLPQQEMDQIEAKIHGKPGEQERIRVRLIDYYPAAVLATRDAKLISLVFAHQQHKQAHKL